MLLLRLQHQILTHFKEPTEHVTWDLTSQLLQLVQLEERVLLLCHLPQSGTAGFPVDREMDLAPEYPVPSLSGGGLRRWPQDPSMHANNSGVCVHY